MGLHKYSGTGCLYAVDVDADGTHQGNLRRLGNAYPLTITVSTSTQKEISRLCDSAGQVLDSKTELDEIVGKLTLRQWNAKNLAWALMGDAAELTTTGGSVTDEAVTAPAVDEYVQLDNQRISSVVVTDSGGGTTYVAGTDYAVNARLGLLTILAGGAISAGDSLLVDYAYAAASGYRVSIGTQALIKVALLGSLKNEFTDEEFSLELYKASLAPSGEINFISEPGSEGEVLEFDLILETPSSRSTPGTIDGVPM